MENDLKEIMLDSLKHQRKETKFWKKVSIALTIVLVCSILFLSCFYYAGFVWYESQFEYVDMETDTSDVNVSTEGDNATAEYNDVEGNQYNDNATHNQ